MHLPNPEIAGQLADNIVAECPTYLTSGLIYVCSTLSIAPLAIRTLDNEGIGEDTKFSIRRQLLYLSKARVSSRLALNSEKSGPSLTNYLKQEKRNSKSYGYTTPPSLEPLSVIDDSKSYIATLVTDDMTPSHAMGVITDSLKSSATLPLLEYTKVARLLEKGLIEKFEGNEDLGGMVIISKNGVNKNTTEPATVYAQAVGKFKPGAYDVIASKASAVVITGLPSGSVDRRRGVSTIEGAVPVSIFGLLRIISVGGLRPGSADRKLIADIVEANPSLGISLLGSIPSGSVA